MVCVSADGRDAASYKVSESSLKAVFPWGGTSLEVPRDVMLIFGASPSRERAGRVGTQDCFLSWNTSDKDLCREWVLRQNMQQQMDWQTEKR